MGQAWEGSGGMGAGFASKQHSWGNQYPSTLQQQQQQQHPRRRRRQQQQLQQQQQHEQQQQQQFQEQLSYSIQSGVSYVPAESDCLLATGQPAPPQLPTPSSLLPVVSSSSLAQPSLYPSGQSPRWSSAFVSLPFSSLPGFSAVAPSCVSNQAPSVSRPVPDSSSAFVRYRRPSSLRELPPCRSSQAVTPALRLTIGLRSLYGGIAYAASSRSKTVVKQQQQQPQQQQEAAPRVAAAQFSGFVGSVTGNNLMDSSISPHHSILGMDAAGSSVAADLVATGAAVSATPWDGSYQGWGSGKHGDAGPSSYIPAAGEDSRSPYYPESSGVDQDGCYVRYSDFTLPEGQLHVGPHLPLLAGRFRFVQSLSEGGSARVFVAKDTWHPSERTVVVKAMHRHYREVGLQEQQLLRYLNTIVDPNDSCRIVRLLAGFDFQGHTCLVLERLQGSLLEHMCRPADSPGSAAAAASAASAAASAANVAAVAVAAAGMASGSPQSALGRMGDSAGTAAAAVMAAATAADVAAEAAAARLEEIRSLAHDLILSIATLHASGIIHGDLKPENILMQPLPSPPSPPLPSTSDPYFRHSLSGSSPFLSTTSTSSLVSPTVTGPAVAAAAGSDRGFAQFPPSQSGSASAEGSRAAGGSSAWCSTQEPWAAGGYPLPYSASSSASSGGGGAFVPQVAAKIADFGNSFTPEQIRTLCHDYNVQTLAYRAPEVLLGVPFSAAIDLWSLGCILAELATGQLLFACESPQHLLQQMVALLAVAPPACLFGSGKFFPKLTAAAGVPRVCCCRAEAGDGMSACSRGCGGGGGGWYGGGIADGCSGCCGPMAFNIFSPGHSRLGDALAAVDGQLADLVAGLLQYDPRVRLTAQQALSHPFLKPLRMSASSSSLSSKDLSNPLTPCTVLPTPPITSPLTLYSYHHNLQALPVPSLLLPPSLAANSAWAFPSSAAAAGAAAGTSAGAVAGDGAAGGAATAGAAMGVPQDDVGLAARFAALGGGEQGSDLVREQQQWSLQQAAASAGLGATMACKADSQGLQQQQQQRGHAQEQFSAWGGVFDGLGTELGHGAGGNSRGLYAMAEAAAAAGMSAGANGDASGGNSWWNDDLAGGPWFGAQQPSGAADASPATAASAAMAASAAAAAAVSAASAGAAAAAAAVADEEALALQQAISNGAAAAAAAAMLSCYGYGVPDIQEGAYLHGRPSFTPEGLFLPHSQFVPLTPDHLSLGTPAPSAAAAQLHAHCMGFAPAAAAAAASAAGGNPKGLVFEPLSPLVGHGGVGGGNEGGPRGLVGVASTELLLAPMTPNQTREAHMGGWESVVAAGRNGGGGGGGRGVGAGGMGMGLGAGSEGEDGSDLRYVEQDLMLGGKGAAYGMYDGQQVCVNQYVSGAYDRQQNLQQQQQQQQYVQYQQQEEYQQQVDYHHHHQQQQQQQQQQGGVMGYMSEVCGHSSSVGDGWMNHGMSLTGDQAAAAARHGGEESKWGVGRMGGGCGVEYSEAPWLVAHGTMGGCAPAAVRLGW